MMAQLIRLALVGLLALWAFPAAAQSLMVAADHSLTAAEYIANGVPSPARTWHEDELRKALTVLQKLAAADPLKLPRLQSKASAEVFARLTTPVPLAKESTATVLARDVTSTTELRQRIGDLSGYAQPLGALALLYAKPLAGDFCFDAELVESTRVALEVNAHLLRLINRARVLNGEQKVPDWIRREHTQVAYGSALTIRGALFIFAARRAFRPEWRDRLSVDVQKWVPLLMAELPEAAYPEIMAHLHGLMLEDPKGFADWQPIQQVMTFVPHGPPGFAKPRTHGKRHKKK
jgi:hypothetical protein